MEREHGDGSTLYAARPTVSDDPPPERVGSSEEADGREVGREEDRLDR